MTNDAASRPSELTATRFAGAPVARLVGSAMLLASLAAEMALARIPDVRGALPPGGLLGSILAQGLRAA